ncbi:MAG: hypothetical protein LBF02_02280 [Mycoplasmataceae bacterium]|nr:hypothetical protein [Mycoplasmataceae bacterium]
MVKLNLLENEMILIFQKLLMHFKKILNFFLSFIILFSAYIPFLTSLTSCSVSKVFIKTNKADVLLNTNDKITVSCEFSGLNPNDFDWKIEGIFFFKEDYLDLQKSTTTIFKKTIFVTIPISSNIPEWDFFISYFDIVFYSKKDSSVFKRTKPIKISKDLSSPIIENDFSIALNQFPYLEEEYFYIKKTAEENCLDVIDFLNIKEPTTDEKGKKKYDFEDQKRIFKILQSDLALYILYVLTNLKTLEIASGVYVDVNIENFISSNVKYIYNTETKTFQELSIDILLEGKILKNLVKINGKIKFDLFNGYKIIGAYTRTFDDKIFLLDNKRYLLGNFLSIVPENKSSYSHVDIDISIPIIKLSVLKFNHYNFQNNDGNLGIANDNWIEGKNAGFWIPCFNLDGIEFVEKYTDKFQYTGDIENVKEVTDTLLVKDIKKIEISSLLPSNDTEISFLVKKEYWDNFINQEHYYYYYKYEIENVIMTLESETSNLFKKIIVNHNWKNFEYEWFQWISTFTLEKKTSFKFALVFNPIFFYNKSKVIYYPKIVVNFIQE